MKIAISAQGNSLQSPLDPRFGRAAGFIIVDGQTGAHEYRDNAQNLSLPQGAGIQAAMHVKDAGVEAVITGHVGPKAFAALSKGNIKVYYTQLPTVGAAYAAFTKGELLPAQDADKQGHW